MRQRYFTVLLATRLCLKQRTLSRLTSASNRGKRVLRHDSEASVEADKEILPPLASYISATSLSCRVPRSALHSTLRLRRQGEHNLYSQLVHHG